MVLLNEWVEANIRTVAERYPQFSVAEPPQGSGSLLAFEGNMTPFDGGSELGAILDDLNNSISVLVQAGRLMHDPECTRRHAQNYNNLVIDHGVSFAVRLLAFPPKRHPRVFAISPDISKKSHPDHPHLNPDSSLCSYFPCDNVLPWNGSTISTILDFSAIWLAKHHVWDITRKNGRATWIGPAASHTPYDLLRTVRDDDPCHCGSGRRFHQCCQPGLRRMQDDFEHFIARLGIE